MLRIDEIELTNFKNYDTLKANFSEGVNLFVGVNGSGKTSLLEAICVASGAFFRNREKLRRDIKSSEMKVSAFLKNQKTDFRTERKAQVCATNNFFSKNKNLSSHIWVINSKIADYKYPDGYEGFLDPIGKYGDRILDGFDLFEDRTIAPILAFYSTKRHLSIKDFSTEEDISSPYQPNIGRYNGYLNWYSETGIKDVIMHWFKNAVTRRATNQIKEINSTDTVLENVEFVVKETLIEFLDLPKDFPLKIYSEPDYDYQLFLNYDNQHDLPLTYYSDGFKNLLFLIIDLAWRASQLNPWMQWEELSAEISGVVMIDEIDLHLHPRWQAKAIPWLQQLFPKVQFFITTHSPTAIANFKNGSLYRLENNKVERVHEHHFGKEVNYIITNILGADDRNVSVTSMLGKLYSLIDDDLPDNSVAIEKQLADLTEILGDSDPDIQKAKAMIAWNIYKNEDTNAVH